MPQSVSCSGCGEILYQHPTEMKPPYEIINLYGKCPKCGKELKFDYNSDVTVLPAPNEKLKIILLPQIKGKYLTKERRYEESSIKKLTAKPSIEYHKVKRSKFKGFTPIRGIYKNKYDVRATILMALKKGISLQEIFDPNEKSLSTPYRKYFNYLVSMGYIDENTRKPTETGLIFLKAYIPLRRLLRGKDVVEYLFLDVTVEDIAFDLFKNIKWRNNFDIYADLLMVMKKEPKRKFELMEKARQNADSLNKNLSVLMDAQLITCTDNHKSEMIKYGITDRGLDYINRYLYFILFCYGGIGEDKWKIIEQTEYDLNPSDLDKVEERSN